jgi:LysM repeat protein
MNTTVSVENNQNRKWEPNREGPRFKEFIEIKKKDSYNIDENFISDQASIILSKCINPNNVEEVNLNSTGLVIGQVQSGKTLSMTSVAAMAKDNGFGIVIVLSGAVSPLSFQTAERIAKELQGRRIIKIINNPKDNWSEQDTNKVRNFIENYMDQSIPEDRKKTILIISHKNPAKINKITEVFLNEKKYLNNIPTLIIDDECDHHSLNSSDYKNDLSKLTEKQKAKLKEVYQINQNDTWETISETYGTSIEELKDINNIDNDLLPNPGNWILLQEIETRTFEEIIDLRSAFSFHTYLGYTATPQALTVIDLDNSLKPSFVHPLPPGKGYTGLNFFFPQKADSFAHQNSYHINDIEDDLAETLLNNSRPESLTEAVHNFIIGVAYGLLNNEDDEEDSNRSMIIHPHNETSAHMKFIGYTKGILGDLKSGLSANKQDTAYTEIYELLKKSYLNFKKKNNLQNLPNFNEEFIKYILLAIKETELIEFNARVGRIEEIKWKEIYSAILIGGVGLERGYTVKGLTVSYLSRSLGGKQQDTLLQRARFFGYHMKYDKFIQIYLSKDLQKYFQQISQINNNFLKSINEFLDKYPNKSFKDWAPIYLGSEAGKHELTRKGLYRSRSLFKCKANEPIVNKFNHLLEPDKLEINYKLYELLENKLRPSLKPLHELAELYPKYKSWAKTRKIYISENSMNMRDLYDLFNQLQFHNNEWRNFLLAKLNFEFYKNDDREIINKRKCPVLFMNYKAEDGKDLERSTLKGSTSINPHAGKNSNYKKEIPGTYDLFPGDRLIHYDFLTGDVSPNSEITVGKKYPTLQIHFFDKVHNKTNGKTIERVPYFSIYPSSDMWMDIIKVD